jgi:hypothetical protein
MSPGMTSHIYSWLTPQSVVAAITMTIAWFSLIDDRSSDRQRHDNKRAPTRAE